MTVAVDVFYVWERNDYVCCLKYRSYRPYECCWNMLHFVDELPDLFICIHNRFLMRRSVVVDVVLKLS